MSKRTILIFAILSIACNVIAFILFLLAYSAYQAGNTAVLNGSGLVVGSIGQGGAVLALIAMIGAIRNAWWCRAYGWLVLVIFTGPFGALAYALLGPGRLAVKTEQQLKWLLWVGPQGSGVPTVTSTAQWTVPLLKYSLNYYARGGQNYDPVSDEDNGTLVRAIQRFGWRVLSDETCQRA